MKSRAILKRSTMLIVSIMAVAAAVVFVVLHHAEKSIEFTVESVGQVDPSGVGVSLLACNPSFVPITVEGIEADLSGSSGNYGSLLVTGSAIPPLSQETLRGRLGFADFNTMETFVGWVMNNQSDADFDATVVVKAKLLGIIPYAEEKNYSLPQFSKMLFGNGAPACKIKDNAPEVRQQLALAQSRMSATSLLYLDKTGLGNGTNHYPLNSTAP